jgi:hypothetical protein
MNRFSILAFTVLLGANAVADTGKPAIGNCPVTTGTKSLGPPFPSSENWYGSESLAVILPQNGRWGLTAPGSRIAVKLFIWSVGYKPGMEQDLSVTVRSVDGGLSDAVVKDITNASAASLGGWTMLAGIDFPSEGCWRITLDYLGQSLSFVVETVDTKR